MKLLVGKTYTTPEGVKEKKLFVRSKNRKATAISVFALVFASLILVLNPHNAAGQASTTTKKRHHKKVTKVRGQQKMEPQRVQEIQEALIREHYLNGDATGIWTPASEDAMRRYQADNGWQSKSVPDSRAIIKLGLGPSKEHLLNPESAMTTVPDLPRSESVAPTSNTAPAVANPAVPATNPAATGSSTPR
jgi:hypothetical protein